MSNPIRLTQFSPGAGCGCKISPKELEKIIRPGVTGKIFKDLIVGNDENDDAAVFDIGNDQSIISTTDFFTPIVDDPFYFGKIAATNAISDIYAMGGRPLMAIAILGWPLDKLPAEIASEVLKGARQVCESIDIPLAGGHSISISEPVFGLAVTGIIKTSDIKRNCGADVNCKLFLTKPLGIGLVSTAQKFGIAKPEDITRSLELMTTLNSVGAELSSFKGIKAITDVTGFGLLGHTLEMAQGNNLCAVLEFDKIPKLEGVDYYIEKGSIPGGTGRNFASYGDKISPLNEYQKAILCDPQTSGGLLLAVDSDSVDQIVSYFESNNLDIWEIGFFTKSESKIGVFVK